MASSTTMMMTSAATAGEHGSRSNNGGGGVVVDHDHPDVVVVEKSSDSITSRSGGSIITATTTATTTTTTTTTSDDLVVVSSSSSAGSGGNNAATTKNKNASNNDNGNNRRFLDDDDNNVDDIDNDKYYYTKLRQEALDVEKNEPELSILLRRTILCDDVHSFEDAIATTVCYRLLLEPTCSGGDGGGGGVGSGVTFSQQLNNKAAEEPMSMFCPHSLRTLFQACMGSSSFYTATNAGDNNNNNNNSASSFLEHGSTMKIAIRKDAMAVIQRDPAVDTLLEVVLFSKGYASLVCHRVAHRLWLCMKRKYTALFIQSQTSAVFGLDIHPLTVIGTGIMFDHGTGVVVGETARIGNDCTILHGVTLGGTGKESGDRHPKVGDNVMIGAGTSILGNIHIGNNSKIGAGSVVLRSIPPNATAVGAPAKIIGKAKEDKPGSHIDVMLRDVNLLHKSKSSAELTTTTTTVATAAAVTTTTTTGSDSGVVSVRSTSRPSSASMTSATTTASLTTLDEAGGGGSIKEDITTTTTTTTTPSDNNSEDEDKETAVKTTTTNNNMKSTPTQQEQEPEQEPPISEVEVVDVSDGCNMCPYREYEKLAITAPPNTINICDLWDMFHNNNYGIVVTKDDIATSFFQLDKRNVGYIHYRDFYQLPTTNNEEDEKKKDMKKKHKREQINQSTIQTIVDNNKSLTANIVDRIITDYISCND